jgi:hypothetical protein
MVIIRSSTGNVLPPLVVRLMLGELVGPLALDNAATYQSDLDRHEVVCEKENISRHAPI